MCCLTYSLLSQCAELLDLVKKFGFSFDIYNYGNVKVLVSVYIECSVLGISWQVVGRLQVPSDKTLEPNIRANSKLQTLLLYPSYPLLCEQLTTLRT